MNTMPSHLIGDNIYDLPTDKKKSSDNDIDTINTLFYKNKSMIDTIFTESKEPLLVALLVFLVSLPQIDDLVQKYIHITSSSLYIRAAVKGCIVMVLYWCIVNFYFKKI